LNSLVISSEISYETLEQYTGALNVKTEILGLGPILLFYSPRKLLSYYLDKPEDFYQSDYYIEATGSSEESPHKGFPLTENKFGSFMYLPKYLNLLDYQAELSISGISQFRIDLRDEPSCWHSASELQKLLKGDISFKELSQRDFTRGYFKKNKSDVLFHKLKNVDNLTKETNYLGDIVESVKESHMTLEIKKTKIKKGLEIDIITPDKKSKTFKMELLKSIDGRILNEAGPGDYLVLPFLSGMSSNSRVYLRSE
ncbi:MAG: U32 family peptidase, partial [Bdellovibrionales bacterium]